MSKKNLHKKQKKTAAPFKKEEQVEIVPAAEQVEAAPVKEKKQKAEKARFSLGVFIGKYATALVVVLVLFWFGCTTVVREGSCAVILRFGAVREEVPQ